MRDLLLLDALVSSALIAYVAVLAVLGLVGGSGRLGKASEALGEPVVELLDQPWFWMLAIPGLIAGVAYLI